MLLRKQEELNTYVSLDRVKRGSPIAKISSGFAKKCGMQFAELLESFNCRLHTSLSLAFHSILYATPDQLRSQIKMNSGYVK